ncbi:DNA replication and repair protein RecF, partial [Pseudobutyrivibrio sp.]
NIIVKDIHSKITSGKENIDVSYDPNIEDIFFLDELVKNKEKDMRFCQTSVGPHRDDIKITVDGIDIRKFGSQGQQRTCALSLKLSEIKLVENTINDKPILLLDDVLSELDKNRQSDLLDNLLDTQTIITCTGLDEFVKNRFKLNTVYKVTDGSIELITEELNE